MQDRLVAGRIRAYLADWPRWRSRSGPCAFRSTKGKLGRLARSWCTHCEQTEHNEMAVVAAQIHLEVQVRVLVEAAIEAGSERALAVVLQGRCAWSPHDRFVAAILTALFDVTVKDYPGWGDWVG